MAKNPTGQIETSHPILSVLCLLSLSAFFFFFFINVQGIWHNASKMCLTRELWAHIFSSWGDANFIQAWKRLNVSPERRNCEAQSSAFKGWRPKWVPTCCYADHTPQQTQHFTKHLSSDSKLFPAPWNPGLPSECYTFLALELGPSWP